VQDMRALPACALGVERRPLTDPETVLLIDHARTEPGELDRVLDQGVRADDQRQLAARELAEQVGTAPRGS